MSDEDDYVEEFIDEDCDDETPPSVADAAARRAAEEGGTGHAAGGAAASSSTSAAPFPDETATLPHDRASMGSRDSDTATTSLSGRRHHPPPPTSDAVVPTAADASAAADGAKRRETSTKGAAVVNAPPPREAPHDDADNVSSAKATATRKAAAKAIRSPTSKQRRPPSWHELSAASAKDTSPTKSTDPTQPKAVVPGGKPTTETAAIMAKSHHQLAGHHPPKSDDDGAGVRRSSSQGGDESPLLPLPHEGGRRPAHADLTGVERLAALSRPPARRLLDPTALLNAEDPEAAAESLLGALHMELDAQQRLRLRREGDERAAVARHQSTVNHRYTNAIRRRADVLTRLLDVEKHRLEGRIGAMNHADDHPTEAAPAPPPPAVESPARSRGRHPLASLTPSPTRGATTDAVDAVVAGMDEDDILWQAMAPGIERQAQQLRWAMEVKAMRRRVAGVADPWDEPQLLLPNNAAAASASNSLAGATTSPTGVPRGAAVGPGDAMIRRRGCGTLAPLDPAVSDFLGTGDVRRAIVPHHFLVKMGARAPPVAPFRRR